MMSEKKAQLVISVRSSLREAPFSHPELLAGIDRGSLRQTPSWPKNTSASRCFFPSWCHDSMGPHLRAAEAEPERLSLAKMAAAAWARGWPTCKAESGTGC